MSNHAEYTRELAHAGHAFKVEIFTDDHGSAPWENCDTHGPVRCALKADKRPGELIMSAGGSRDYWYFYDVQAATLIALRDGWRPAITPPGVQTKRTLAAAAVQADFNYLRAWLRDEWHYVGVCVTHEASGAHASLWGIESTAGAYLDGVARECADECMSDVVFTEWKARLADRERALDVADRLSNWAVKTERKRAAYYGHPHAATDRFCTDMQDAAELLRSLARG